jgi:2-dehydro-3-deoxyglucarate aldolase
MHIRDRLRNEVVSIGSWITLRDPAVAEIMAKAGFDWLAVDLEHTSLGLRDAIDLVRVIDLCGVAPLVRLSANDSVLIKRLMDGGAQGIIVPMVNTASEARMAVAACRYPPAGHRGVGLSRAQTFGETFDDYFAHNNERAVVIVQIEHQIAVRNVADILAVDGVDALLIGPYDLSASMDIPGQFDHPKLKENVARVIEAAQRVGKPAGFHAVSSDIAPSKAHLASGVRLLAYSVDMVVLNETFRVGLAALRAAVV